MHFHFRFTVLKRISGAFGPIREPAFLAQWHEADSEGIGDGRTKEKSTGVNPHDFVDFFPTALPEENFDRCTKQCAVFQDWRDVLENDSGLGEIWDIAHCFAQLGKGFVCHRRAMLAPY